jgi:MoaA/NifB/PqqE/SkfB family radical SAM enzyme
MWSTDTIEWIDIELTSFCNIQCPGCFRTQSQVAEKIIDRELLSFDLIQQKFQQHDFPNIKIINFCGSVDEPTSHPEFFDIIKYFATWNCHINIATNGSIRSAQWWHNLAKILPANHRVTWGIDGADKTSEIYRQGSKFEKVQENFQSFISAGGQAVWQIIEFEHNLHQIDQAREIANQQGFKSFKIIRSHRPDVKHIKHVKQTTDQSNCIECKYKQQKRIFVNHNGNVIPCCFLNAQMLEYSATGIVKNKFEEILEKNDYINQINIKNVSIKIIIKLS